MKKHPLLLALFVVSISIAQDLYVSNNAATYVFVDGAAFDDTPIDPLTPNSNVPLFVTNNIELAGANSFIYLRNEAQLLQSASSTGNSGLGNLSVYQEGNVSAYEYNYWCSPIGSKVASVVSNPFGVTLLNDITSVTNSSPAGVNAIAGYNGTASPLNIEQRWVYKYTNPSNLYSSWVPVFAATTVNPGEGFTMKGTDGVSANNPGNAQRYDFRGKPNTGTFTHNVGAPVAGVPQQTLVGNPYPSAMDARAFIHDSPQNTGAIDGVLYYWEQAPIGSHFLAQYQGGYAEYTINAAGTMETYVPAVFFSYDSAGNSSPLPPPGANGVKFARRFIPIGQGFMVQGSNPTNGSVRTTNDMRVFYKETSAYSDFFRIPINTTSTDDTNSIEYNEYGLSIVPSDAKRFRVNVDFNNLYKRQLVQNFHSTATNGFDYGLETRSPEGLDSDAYWVLNNEPYTIQAFSFDENLRIPLVVKIATQQPVSFSIFDVQNFDESHSIFIHDIEANIYVNLREQNYNINLPIGDYSNRFEITFEDHSLSTPEVTIDDFKIFQDNPQSQLTVLNPSGLDIKSVSMYDTAGKQIFDARNLSTEMAYHFTTKTLSEGIYVASITLGDNQVVSKKVIVKN